MSPILPQEIYPPTTEIEYKGKHSSCESARLPIVFGKQINFKLYATNNTEYPYEIDELKFHDEAIRIVKPLPKIIHPGTSESADIEIKTPLTRKKPVNLNFELNGSYLT